MATGSNGPRFIYLSVVTSVGKTFGDVTSEARVRSKNVDVYYANGKHTVVLLANGRELKVSDTPEQIDALLSTLLPKWRKKK